jgi:hypothetical protein
MAHFVGLDVSVKETSVCVVDDAGKVILEQKVLTEPDTIIALLTSLGATYGRIGIEAGPLSQWLVNALTAAELSVICVETRHMKALLTTTPIQTTIVRMCMAHVSLPQSIIKIAPASDRRRSVDPDPRPHQDAAVENRK